MGAFAQDSPEQGTITAPPSTRGLPSLKVHTPLYIFTPASVIHDNNPSPSAETPSSLACIYGAAPPTAGCPRNGTVVSTGGSKAIAVVDYGNNSTLQSDFNTFTSHYGLPAQTLNIQCACPSGCPSSDGTGWDLETALDVEYAHAMAPNAQIIVSEFCSDPLGDGAEANAAQYIAANYGAGEISNGWTYNGGEAWCGSGPCELQYDSIFTQNGIVYFGSAGDDGLGPAYPSISPNVISAGGTVIQRTSGNFTGETCWNDSGGGISQFEPLPPYQLAVARATGPHRGTPDWAADASPNTGAAVYSTTACGGWCTVGGTSLASPLLAGLTNFAGHFDNRTVSELLMTYAYYRTTQYHRYFFDITSGSNGSPAAVGWDQCTGLGSPRDLTGF